MAADIASWGGLTHLPNPAKSPDIWQKPAALSNKAHSSDARNREPIWSIPGEGGYCDNPYPRFSRPGLG